MMSHTEIKGYVDWKRFRTTALHSVVESISTENVTNGHVNTDNFTGNSLYKQGNNCLIQISWILCMYSYRMSKVACQKSFEGMLKL